MESFVNECTLPKFFRRSGQHILMMGWIAATHRYLPSVSINDAIRGYLNHYNIDGDVAVLKKEYYRMLKELKDLDTTI